MRFRTLLPVLFNIGILLGSWFFNTTTGWDCRVFVELAFVTLLLRRTTAPLTRTKRTVVKRGTSGED